MAALGRRALATLGAMRTPRQLPLFGEPVVTLDDVLAWMLAVPGIPPWSPRFGHYVRTYDVPEKIRQAKLAGTFDAIVAEGDRLSTAAAVPPGAAIAQRLRFAYSA